jgi:hypothetical protein
MGSAHRLEVLVPRELAEAALAQLEQAFREFIVKYEEASMIHLVGAFTSAARGYANELGLALLDELTNRPPAISPEEQSRIAGDVAREYSATRRLVRDEP